MDWSRAKTILIVIFACLNIFLMYNIYINESKNAVISEKEIANITNILSNNSIKLNASLPKRIYPQKFLEVQDISYDKEQLANSFLEESEILTVIDEDKTIYVSKEGNKSLEIYNNKRIIYKNNSPKDNIEKYSKNKVIKYVEKFLEDKNFKLSYIELDEFKETDKGYDISFKQVYKSNEIFVSYMKVQLNNSGITKIDCFWLNPIEYKDDSKNIIKSPIQILLLFIKDVKNINNVVVEEIELGYYFPVENYNNTSFTATPVWKIQINNGVIFYYNAYEGYLEYTNYKG